MLPSASPEHTVQDTTQAAATSPLGDEARLADSVSEPSADTDSEPSTSPYSFEDNLEECFKDDAIALRERFVLDEVLAVGARCIVYKAHYARHEGSESSAIVIKTLRPELRQSSDAFARLTREFRHAAALNHPNFPRVFERAQAGGTWYVAMEFLDGQSLATLLHRSQSKPLPMGQVSAILRACSAALSFAHRHGVLHCDFRPDNVWLTAAQEVRIIGLDAALSGRSSVTGKAGAIDTCELPLSSVPTTGYASPEVLAGEMPDRRDDVFSFACVAYELFSAQPPFGRLSALEMKMSRTTLTRPSGMPPRRWREFKRALHWKRAQRTATVHAVLLSLDYSTAKEIIGASSAALATVAQSLVVARDSVALHVPPLSRALKSHLYRLGFELIRLTAATADAVARNLQRATVRLGNLSDTAAIELSRAARRTTRWTTPRTSFDRLRALVAGAIHDLAARCETLAISYWRTMQRRWLPLDRRLRDSATNRWLPVGVTAVALVSLTVLDRTSESSVAQRPSASIAQSATRSATNEAAERSHEINFSPLSFAGDSFLPTGRYAEWPLAAAWQRSVQFVSPLAVHATLFDGPAPQFTFASQSTANRAIKPSSVIAFDNATVAVSDRAYAAVLLLKRTGSTQDPAIVRWRTVVGSAKPGTDYQNIDSGIARFADRQSIRALYVPLTPNRNAQGSRSFTVELSNASGGAALGQIRRTVVTIEGRE